MDLIEKLIMHEGVLENSNELSELWAEIDFYHLVPSYPISKGINSLLNNMKIH